MRRGAHPKDAGMEALRRIKANTIEKRLLNSNGLPNFGVNFYILNARGEYAGLTMYQGANAKFAICNESGPQTLSCEDCCQASGRLRGQERLFYDFEDYLFLFAFAHQ